MSEKNEAQENALRDLERAEGDVRRGDLKHAEEEAREAVEELKHTRHDELVTIIVDDVEHKIRRGKWLVRDLKANLGIDPAKVLAEITPNGVKDLDDNQEIEVHAHEKFMTHARSGGSS
jgi:hypothetical protein